MAAADEPWFERTTADAKALEVVRSSVIGDGASIGGPFGERVLTFADHAGSGRPLHVVEDFIAHAVAPLHAAPHADTHTGCQSAALRDEARSCISKALGANPEEYVTLFVGTGRTAGVHKLIAALGLARPPVRPPAAQRPVVFIGPFEGLSNELPWRESNADVVVVPEARETGILDVRMLRAALAAHVERQLRIVSCSAGSEATGIANPVAEITLAARECGALCILDYAAAAPYARVHVCPDERHPSARVDALVLAPHRLPGGPGAAGVLVARRALFRSAVPTEPGAGTAAFVSPWEHAYAPALEAREEAGTPALLQAVRAGLAVRARQLVGEGCAATLNAAACAGAIRRWSAHPHIHLLGADRSAYWAADRLPVVSLNILWPSSTHAYVSARGDVTGPSAAGAAALAPARGGRRRLHPSFVATLLNDVYGIQARASQACPGPYAARLLGWTPADAAELRALVCTHGLLAAEQHCVRVSLCWSMEPKQLEFVIDAVEHLATHGWRLLPLYAMHSASGRWVHREQRPPRPRALREFGLSPAPASHVQPSARAAQARGAPDGAARSSIESASSKPLAERRYAQLAGASDLYTCARGMAMPLAEAIRAPGGDFVRGHAGPLGDDQEGGDKRARRWMRRRFVFPSDALRRLGLAGERAAVARWALVRDSLPLTHALSPDLASFGATGNAGHGGGFGAAPSHREMQHAHRVDGRLSRGTMPMGPVVEDGDAYRLTGAVLGPGREAGGAGGCTLS